MASHHPTLSRKAFAAITAVEGLRLPDANQRELDKMRKSGMSAPDIRAAILKKYKALAAK